MQINQLSMAQRLPVYGHPRGESVTRRRIFRLIRLAGGVLGIGGTGSLGTTGWKARARGSKQRLESEASSRSTEKHISRPSEV